MIGGRDEKVTDGAQVKLGNMAAGDSDLLAGMGPDNIVALRQFSIDARPHGSPVEAALPDSRMKHFRGRIAFLAEMDFLATQSFLRIDDQCPNVLADIQDGLFGMCAIKEYSIICFISTFLLFVKRIVFNSSQNGFLRRPRRGRHQWGPYNKLRWQAGVGSTHVGM